MSQRGTARVTELPMRRIDSTHSTWLFDTERMRFCRLPRGLLVVGAGSGKTRAHARVRVPHRRAARSPVRAAAITFTNKAAGEMKAASRSSSGRSRRMWVSTFHSMCALILRRGDAVGVAPAVLDLRPDRRGAPHRLRAPRPQPRSEALPARRLHAAISALKNELCRGRGRHRVGVHRAGEAPGSGVHRVPAQAARRVSRRLRRSARPDREPVPRPPRRSHRWRHRFRQEAITVDEFQDTNMASRAGRRFLTEEHRNVMVVGDQDQCLVAGTRITLADGSLCPIAAVKAGDEVSQLRQRRLPAGARPGSTRALGLLDGVAMHVVRPPGSISHRDADFAGFPTQHHPERGPRRAGDRVVEADTASDCDGRPVPRSHVHPERRSEGREGLELIGLSVRPARPGSSGWRFETANADMGRIADRSWPRSGRCSTSRSAPSLASLRTVRSREGNSLPFTPASSVRPGMVMVGEDTACRRGDVGRGRGDRRPRVRPRHRAHPQLRRRRGRHAQQRDRFRRRLPEPRSAKSDHRLRRWRTNTTRACFVHEIGGWSDRARTALATSRSLMHERT